jgi:hypothetical protein
MSPLQLVQCSASSSAAAAPAFLLNSTDGTLCIAQDGQSTCLLQPSSASSLASSSSASSPTPQATTAAEPQRSVFTVLCDPPGKPSSSDQCGCQKFAEPLQLNAPDSFTAQYHTQSFVYHPTTGTLAIDKSGHKCVGVEAVVQGARLALYPCGTSSNSLNTKWALQVGDKASQISLVPVVAVKGAAASLCIGFKEAAASGDLTTWIVDRPFDPPLDSRNQVTIVPYVGQIAFNGNRYSDGGEIQV